MPSKVRFQTEYMSTFSKKENSPQRANRSPILKPRFKPNDMESEKSKFSEIKDAGISSTSLPLTIEPPLQHKRIVDYNYNHNIRKTSTTEWNEKKLKENSEEKPILEYDAAIQKSRKEERPIGKIGDEKSATVKDTTTRIAGKSSNNLRYLALEPAMQRKRTSPYKMNHNLLKAHTTNALNEDTSSNTSRQSSEIKETADQKDINTVKRKLEFKNGRKEDKDIYKTNDNQSKIKPSDPEGDKVKINAESQNISEKNHAFQPQNISPTKLQRKKDLEEVKNKQNQRVDRALQIKAGLQTIEPPLHSHHVESEYQRQFSWKEPVIIKNAFISPHADFKNMQTSTHVTKKKPRKQNTEYQRQYKHYTLIDEQKNVKDVEAKNYDKNEDVKQDTKEEPRGAPDKRLIRPSRNEQPLFFPHAEYGNVKTEYEANFQPPVPFEVRNGVWEDAAPPHLYPSKLKQGDISMHNDWFKEVLRLREKAEEYKVRSRNTHYPTTFYASLQDDESDASENSSRKNSTSVEPDSNVVIPMVKNILRNNENKETKESKKIEQSLNEKDYNASHMIEENVEKHDDDADDDGKFDDSRPSTSTSESCSSDNNLFKGRINTARLASSTEHRRHNLDRTTLLRSGTVAEPMRKISSEILAPSYSFRSSVNKPNEKIISMERSRKNHHKKYDTTLHENQDKIRKAPFVSKTYKYSNYEDKENRNDLIVTDLEFNQNKHSYDLNNSNLDKIIKPPRAFVQPSEVGNKYGITINKSNIDDVDMFSEISLSARDSIISDVFERSKIRRDNFW